MLTDKIYKAGTTPFYLVILDSTAQM